jgi:hypothetical protein
LLEHTISSTAPAKENKTAKRPLTLQSSSEESEGSTRRRRSAAHIDRIMAEKADVKIHSIELQREQLKAAVQVCLLVCGRAAVAGIGVTPPATPFQQENRLLTPFSAGVI